MREARLAGARGAVAVVCLFVPGDRIVAVEDVTQDATGG